MENYDSSPAAPPCWPPTEKELQAILTLRKLGVAVTALARMLKMKSETLYAWFNLQKRQATSG